MRRSMRALLKSQEDIENSEALHFVPVKNPRNAQMCIAMNSAP